MRKIPTLFLRDDPNDPHHVTPHVNPAAAWVFDSETAVATRKYDGTCVMLDETYSWWARREVKPGKLEPVGWVLADVDDVTGKRMGWVPIDDTWQFAKMMTEALDPQYGRAYFSPGTYELCGPKINGNPENYTVHQLIRHAEAEIIELPHMLTYAWFAERMPSFAYEGIVWHQPDGRMAKLKRKDFR